MCESKKSDVFIIYLMYLTILQFQSNKFICLRTWNFQLKLSDTAATLKYGQGHWNWYEYLKLNEYCVHAEFDIYHICDVWENHNIQAFAKHNNHQACLILIITYSHFSSE